MKRKMVVLVILLITIVCLASCGSSVGKEDIIILYTNDVHCQIEGGIGYAGLSAYKKELQKKNKHVTLVDCGDAIQGDTIGTVSKGEYIVQLMNDTGYDIAVFGNHEFDYGIPVLSHLISQAKATYVCANLNYTGTASHSLVDVKAYEIIDYGSTSVAYIGATTPHSLTSSTPTHFMDEEGNFIYDFYNDADGTRFYTQMQTNIDECREKGADYVVVCAHLGDGTGFSPYSSNDLANNTTGIDCILDGHAHDTLNSYIEKNKAGENVLFSSTGTKLSSIGQLMITANGNISTTLITNYQDKDQVVVDSIHKIKSEFESTVNKVVAHSDVRLSGTDSSGIRMVRSRETSIGNFCADAYREMAHSDIAIVNGGGIRDDLPQGDVTYADLIRIHPYGNYLNSVKATGQQIIDALEVSYHKVEKEYSDGTNTIGESGEFLQVSGLKLEVNTGIESSVVFDTQGMFKEVTGVRRVQNVQVENADGSFSPIDVSKTYTVASHNYILQSGGNGMNMFQKNEFVISEGTLDYEVLINYIENTLQGSLGDKYSTIQGRITIL